ncbi:MAG: VCBS repeat-containing protein [Planctomycetaceae bacterium]|nr:VCBS repeat-containing protein [Planctomycetaceae bacterium]
MKIRALALVALVAAPGFLRADEEHQVSGFHVKYLALYGRRESTLNYDFDGDGKLDILNVTINSDVNPPERWLAIHYQRQGDYSESPDVLWPLSDQACALVLGDFLPGGGTEIGFLAEDGVYVYPWNAAAKRPAEQPIKLIHVRTFFRAPTFRQIPLWQWKMDLSGDGLDDLIVPLPSGYRLYFQTAPGVFGKTSTLESDLQPGSERVLGVTAYADAPEISPSQFVSITELPRLEIVDINGDGLPDLVLIRKNTMTYFLQKEPGVFSAVRPNRVSYEIATLRDEIKKDSVNLNLIKFIDINGDRIADLVVTKIEGQLGLFDSIKTSIYLHLGTGRGNFNADRRIVIDGVSIDPEFIDMNGDGKLDVVTSRLRTDLLKQAANSVLLGDVTMTYEVFQFDSAKNGFMSEPVYEKQIFVRKSDLEKTGAGAVPLVFIRGDLTGDGRPDMVVIDPRTNELLIHPGRIKDVGRGPQIDFDKTAHYTVKIDKHPRSLQLMDVNSDGINDIILYYNGSVGLVLSEKK